METKSNTFERDQLDEFKLTLEKVGKPYKVAWGVWRGGESQRKEKGVRGKGKGDKRF